MASILMQTHEPIYGYKLTINILNKYTKYNNNYLN